VITANLSIDDKKLLSTLSPKGLEKQVNFATAKTLTQVAFDSRRKVQAMLRHKLSIKRQFLPRSVVVTKATPKNKEAIVGFLERAHLVELLEEGGTRVPRSSKNIAIPHAAKSARGRVTKAKRPDRLLQLPNTFVATINGNKGIWQSFKKGGKTGVRLMYDLEPRVRYDRGTITFHKAVDTTARHSFRNRFKKNFWDAVRTAKR